MSHELRTPPNTIIGVADLCLLKPIPAPVEQNAQDPGAAGHLLTIINDIPDFSRIEAGRPNLESTLFGLPELYIYIYIRIYISANRCPARLRPKGPSCLLIST